MTREELREIVADKVHEVWANWMRYMYSRGDARRGAGIALPQEWVERWQRQMDTPYADLSEEEKDSDRVLADEYIALIMEQLGMQTAEPEEPPKEPEPKKPEPPKAEPKKELSEIKRHGRRSGKQKKEPEPPKPEPSDEDSKDEGEDNGLLKLDLDGGDDE